MTEHVIVTDDEPLRILRLNRPAKKNAITNAMYETLAEALENAAVSKSDSLRGHHRRAGLLYGGRRPG